MPADGFEDPSVEVFVHPKKPERRYPSCAPSARSLPLGTMLTTKAGLSQSAENILRRERGMLPEL
jgi:hypothetical protein